MKEVKIIIDAICSFEEYVAIIHEYFKKRFGIERSPLIALTEKKLPREGKIDEEGLLGHFKFHGTGCKVVLNEIIVEITYLRPDYRHYGFGKWELFEFVKSHKNLYESIKEEAFFFRLLDQMESEQIIEKANPNANVYRVSQ